MKIRQFFQLLRYLILLLHFIVPVLLDKLYL